MYAVIKWEDSPGPVPAKARPGEGGGETETGGRQRLARLGLAVARWKKHGPSGTMQEQPNAT